MQELRMHPFVAAAIGASLLLLSIALIVVLRTAPPRGGLLTVWGSMPISSSNPNATYAPDYDTNTLPVSALGTTTPPFIALDPSISNSDTAQDDIAALIAQLSGSVQTKGTASSSSDASDLNLAYAFIPRGLISTTTPTKARTPAQAALYEYGNDAGSFIQTYDDTHKNAAQTLKDQLEDRRDPQKAQALRDLAMALGHVGDSIAGIDDVPAVAKTMNDALAKSYQDMATKLVAVPDAERDADFIAAIQAYDTAVETFTKRYVALATLFSTSGVTFEPQDGGSVFTFSAAF
jgi:hypothetical protein